MKKYVARLFKKPNGVPVLLPAHVLFFVTFIFGMAFFLPPPIFGVAQATLYQFSVGLHPVIPMIWGFGMIIATTLNTVGALFNNTIVARVGAMVAFALWGYAAVGYIMADFLLGLLTAALPMVLFWGWYYISIVSYQEHKRP